MGRYRIVRFGSGFEIQDLVTERSEMVYDGQIITYRPFNPITQIVKPISLLKISTETDEIELLYAILNEIEE